MTGRAPIEPHGREARDAGDGRDPSSTYLLRGWSTRRVAALLVVWALVILAWPAYRIAQAMGWVP